jgi:hypothetical protein
VDLGLNLRSTPKRSIRDAVVNPEGPRGRHLSALTAERVEDPHKESGARHTPTNAGVRVASHVRLVDGHARIL